MNIHKQNPLFTFSIAESKLIQKAPSASPEGQSGIEAQNQTPDSNESKMDILKDKALKTIDRLGRLMSAMKDEDKVKPKYKENFKKLQEMQKKLQSHLENVDTKKDVLKNSIIDKTFDKLNTRLENNRQLHVLKRHILEGKAEAGGLIKKALRGLETGDGSNLVTIYSLMGNKEKRVLTAGEYKGGGIKKVGDKLVVKHPKKGTLIFTFGIEDGKWNAYDTKGQALNAEGISRMSDEESVGGETIKTQINSEDIAANYYENEKNEPQTNTNLIEPIKRRKVDMTNVTPDELVQNPKKAIRKQKTTPKEYKRGKFENDLINKSENSENKETPDEKLAMNELKGNLQAILKGLGVSDNAKRFAKIIQNDSNGKIAWVPATKIVIKFRDQLQKFTNAFVSDENMTAETFAKRWENIKNPEIEKALKKEYAELYESEETEAVASNEEMTFEADDVREVKISKKDKKEIKKATDSLKKSPLNEQAINQEFEKQFRQANLDQISKSIFKVKNTQVHLADLGPNIQKIKHDGKLIDVKYANGKYITEKVDDDGKDYKEDITFNLDQGDLVKFA